MNQKVKELDNKTIRTINGGRNQLAHGIGNAVGSIGHLALDIYGVFKGKGYQRKH